jgi:hypothetical protein
VELYTCSTKKPSTMEVDTPYLDIIENEQGVWNCLFQNSYIIATKDVLEDYSL